MGTENLFLHPKRLPLVAPSILSADFARLGEECRHVLSEGGADLLHLDVMDGHFVPNLTMGPALCASLRGALPDAFLDVHLMVTDPEQSIAPFRDAGADHLTIHIEPAVDRHSGTGRSPLSEGYDPRVVGAQIREAGMTAGLALNPGTPVEAIEPFLSDFDLILVMSVNPGFSGQSFMGAVLEKVRRLRERVGGKVRIEMDGGIGAETAGACREAGCDVLVAASAVFGRPVAERSGVIRAIRGE